VGRSDGGSARRPVVLVAEDNQANQILAARLLEVLGYDSVVVTDGVQVVEAVSHGRFALVLMDCEMPEMDGFDATREIRRREAGQVKRLPIVAMTAYTTDKDRAACAAAGMDDFIAKPVMVEILRDVLARWTRTDGVEPISMVDPTPGDAFGAARSGVDRAVLRRLEQELGSPAFRGLVDGYLAELPIRREAIADAVRSASAEAMTRAAHILVSSSTALGAQRLAKACRELEALGRAGSLAGAEQLATTIVAECALVQEALSRERD